MDSELTRIADSARYWAYRAGVGVVCASELGKATGAAIGGWIGG